MLNSMCKNYANVRKPLAKLWLVLMTAMSFTPSFAEPDPTEELDLTLAIEGWIFGETPNEPTLTGYEGEGTKYTYYTDGACTKATTKDNGADVEGGVPSYAGTYYVTVDVESGSDTASFTIAKADATLPTPSEKTDLKYTGAAQKLIDSMIVSGGSLKYKVNEGDFEASVPTGINAGNYTIAFEFTPDANHNDTTIASINASIEKASIEPTVTKENWTYGSTPKPTVVTGNNGNGDETIIYYTDEALSKPTTTKDNGASQMGSEPTKGGTYFIKTDIASTQNYNGGSATCSFTIEGKEIDIEWVDTVLVYTGKNRKPSARATGLIKGDSIRLYVLGSQINVGSYIARITKIEGPDSLSYKLPNNIKTTFRILKAEISNFAAPTPNVLTYNASKQKLLTGGTIVTSTNDTAKIGKFVYAYSGINGAEFKDTIPAAQKAGTYKIVYKIIGDQNHNDTKEDTIEVKINPITLNVTWGESAFTYDPDTSYAPIPSVSPLNGDKVTVTVTGASKEPGRHEAKAVLSGEDASNYILAETSATKDFIIKNAQISKPNIEEHNFTYKGSAFTFVEENPAYTITGNAKGTEPGKYLVSIVPNNGYEWTDNSKTAFVDSFFIKKIVVEEPVADTKSFIYNGNEQTFTVVSNTAYSITGNVQTKAGKYKVVVALKDANHYEWRSGSISNIEFDFSIAQKIVDVPVVENDEFIYDGSEKKFEIKKSNDYVIADSNATATNAGKYIRTVSLKDKVNYMWEDNTTADTSFSFTVRPQVLKLPVVETKTFNYTGLKQTFNVPADTVKPARYVVKIQTASAINIGTYTDTLVLVDKLNYVWETGSNKDELITFTITDGKITKPEIATSYVYTGEEISFVAENNAYKIYSGKGTDAGTYKVKVVPSDGYKWETGTKDTVRATVTINKAKVAKPTINMREFIYNGKDQDFKIPANKGYEITGITHAIEPGTYYDTLTLNSNYMWNDTSDVKVVFDFKINKIKVKAPIEDNSTFTYNGEIQEYKLIADSACIISGSKQKNAGTYKVIAALDTAHYVWEDKTNANRTYTFAIAPAKVSEPTVPNLTFIYDGKEKNFEIIANDKCIINPKNAKATLVGTYERTVSLADSANYTWMKGDKADRKFPFEITPITIEMPTVASSYEYSGSPIQFIKDSVAYSVSNGVQTNAGSYDVTVTPNIGYAWLDGTRTSKTIPVTINPLRVDRPSISDTSFIYNGKIQEFGFTTNVGYSFEGKTSAKEPGKYQVRVKLNKNYIWDNDTEYDEIFNFVINKIEVTVPSADVSKFVYNGKEQTYTVTADSAYKVTGNVQKNAGTYSVTVALKDTLHYEWNDTTVSNKTFDFAISKFKVSNPTALISTFIYDGEKKDFKVVENANYVVADSNAVATKTGTYYRTVSLVDTANCIWNDETKAPKSVKFTIGDGTLQIPVVTLEHTYTGDTIVFIPNDGAYTLDNGSKKDVGTYKVSVTPNPGYRWSDSTKTAKEFIVKINPALVDKPIITTTSFTYNKKVIDFKIPANEKYTISGETYGIDLGTYKASLTLKPNYMWSDSTYARVDYLFSINKKIIAIPEVDTTAYVFNGKRQTYVIAKNPDYQVINNLQTYAGSYDVTVILTDFINSIWSDSTAEIKTYKFEIGKATVDLPTAVQQTFVFDGNTKYFAVTDNNNYDVKSTNASATEVGEYFRTVSLKDTLNYTWTDGTLTSKTVKFAITKGTIAIPNVKKDYIFNGSPFTFVPENSAYIVENGTQTNAGNYTVTVTLKDGYVWEDETTEVKTYKVVINPAKVVKPSIPTTKVYTYTGFALGFDVDENDGYSITGITKAIEPGKYEAEITLNPNYIWSDSTNASLKSTITINKVIVNVPAGIDSVFTYNGKVQTYAIPDSIKSYIVNGSQRTNAGDYVVSVILSDTLHYLWNDSTTETKTYRFNIEKAFIEIPTIGIDSFVFNNKSRNFEISVIDSLVDSVYVLNGPNSATNPGLYERIISLTDTINYSWSDSTITDKNFLFTIVEKTIPTIKDMTFSYTGKTITFVPVDSSYSVSNGSAENAGSYFVTITPKTGYSWEDGTFTAKLIKATILPKEISKPVVSDKIEFKYDGKSHKFPLQLGDSCILSGDSIATEPGVYYAKVTPSKNYVWKGGSDKEVTYKFTINKIFVKIPSADKHKFIFNNEEQTYNIAESPNYTISGNVQTKEGKYKVVVALTDTAHYQWSDSTIANKTYEFVINKNEFKINELTQLNDGSMDATPGGYAVLDIDINNGDVYEYSIKCPDCPAFNHAFKAIDSESNTIEILIPDSVKPGIYDVTVTLKSGSVENVQTLKLAVNYPPSKIVVCWSNVLMVDNGSGKFTKYQWYKDGEIIKGATSQYYQDKDGLNGTYHCEVNDGLIIGPAYFKNDMPLVLKARTENGKIIADVIGDTKAKILLIDPNGLTSSKAAGKNVTFEVKHEGVYILNLEGTKQTVKVLVSQK